jgi:hypothetical protein
MRHLTTTFRDGVHSFLQTHGTQFNKYLCEGRMFEITFKIKDCHFQ